MAQPGRALRSGRRGRWFKSSRPDHLFQIYQLVNFLNHIPECPQGTFGCHFFFHSSCRFYNKFLDKKRATGGLCL